MKTKYELIEFDLGGYGVKRTDYKFFGLIRDVCYISCGGIDWKDPDQVLKFCIFETKEAALFDKNILQSQYEKSRLRHKVLKE